jgi:hypothetical protein
MKYAKSIAAMAVVALGTLVLTGCASNGTSASNTSSGQSIGFAGGTGSFGEDPVQPGAYDYPQPNNRAVPAAGHMSPTTSPSSYGSD